MLSLAPAIMPVHTDYTPFLGDDQIRSAVLTFDFNGIPVVEDVGAGSVVAMSGEDSWVSPGEPILPVHVSTIALPQGMEITSVEVHYLDSGATISSDVQLLAAGDDTNAEDNDWTSIVSESFPNVDTVSFSNNIYLGCNLGILRIFPVQYDATAGVLTYHSEIALEVSVQESKYAQALPATGRASDQARVAEMVINPELLEEYALPTGSFGAQECGFAASSDGVAQAAGAPPASYEYVIITSSELEASFEPLIQQKQSRGLSACIVTTEYIYANYTGTETHDDADKVRQFIADSYSNHRTQWVLLGGDVDVVPARGVYAIGDGDVQTNLPTDMYYACLDGPWNGDGDSLWGEYTDGLGGGDVDLMPEIAIGRAPASNATEAANFVAKTILYETTAAPNYSTVVLLGEKLDSSTYGGHSMIAIRDQTLPAGWDFVERYDTSTTSWTGSQLVGDLNASPNIVIHDGHSSSTYNARIDNSTVAGLTNLFPYFMYSLGCNSGSFDTTDICIAEQHVVSEHGAFAVVMNSRLGFYQVGTVPAYSHCYALEFFDAVFNEGKTHLGEANNDSKIDNLWHVGTGGNYRYIYFETNLLGDPETSFQLGSESPTPGVTISQSGGSTAVTEGGATDGYTVVLTSQPTADVTITLGPSSQVGVNPAAVTFTTANWNLSQTVTVSAVDDAVAEGAHTGTIAHTVSSSDGDYNGLSVDSVTVQVTDNDAPGVQITQSGGSTAVTEGGATDGYTVVLTSQPTADVTITLGPSSQVGVNPAAVTFTTANWNLSQTVTVSAVDDAVAEGAHTGTIAHTASSTDAQYNGIDIDAVTANIADNDTAGITVNPTSGLGTTEAGGTATFTVVLNSEPTANVMIGLSSSDTTEGTVSPMSLTFTPGNWNTAQTVTVQGVGDSLVDGNVTYTIETAAATSSDANYNGLNAADVSVTNQDTVGPIISSVLVVEMTGPRDGALTTSESLLITFNAVDLDGVAGATVQVDGQNVTPVYGPYAAASGVNFGVPLGTLSAGAHNYSIVATDNAGNPTSPAYTGTFDVLPATGPTISHVVVAEAGTDKNGTLDSSDNLVITWSATGDDGIASKSLTVDGQIVSAVYGPYGDYYAGVFGPLEVGSHAYTIEVTDTNGIASTHNGTFNVIAAVSAAPQIGNVVVAETSNLPRDGLLNTEETLVLTWTLTDADGIASKSLSVDENTIATIYGPYGNAYAGLLGQLPQGTHTYQIRATDTTGQISTLNGAFEVYAALTLEASAVPTGPTEALTDVELASIAAEATHRLEAVFGGRVSTAFGGVSIQVANLPGNLLGATTDGKILIDRDAARFGWFVDPTPAADEEFILDDLGSLLARKNTAADGRADLLTAVMHEMGHVLGYDHADEGLMDDLLPLGARRTAATDKVFAGYGQ